MTTTFLWASPHKPTNEQVSSLGKVVLLQDINPTLQANLSSQELDTDLNKLALELIAFAVLHEFVIVQPGGSPAFQLTLGKRLTSIPVVDRPSVMFSFSKRVSQDIPQENGTVKKVTIFKHEGWV